MALQVVVLGAGVVGASIAACLAERGANVTLVDRGTPGGGTSSTSFAWVNSNGKEPDDYFEINRLGLEAHRRLGGTSEGWLSAGGHIEIAVDPSHRDRLHERVKRLAERDYPVEVLTPARTAELLPDIRLPSDAELIAHFPREGYAYPAIYVAHALRRARAAGARLITGNAVVGMHRVTGRGAAVLLADASILRADLVVSAVGRWTAELAALVGVEVPMRAYTSPGDGTVGYLLETSPVPTRLDHVVTSPLLNLRPAGGGRLLLQALDLDSSADPGAVPTADSPIAAEFLRRLRGITIGAEFAKAEKLIVAQRSMPADGRTIAGPSPEEPWLYVVATHSGVTLAPFLGEAVADELEGTDRPELAGFRPDRFQSPTTYLPFVVPRHPGEQ